MTATTPKIGVSGLYSVWESITIAHPIQRGRDAMRRPRYRRVAFRNIPKIVGMYEDCGYRLVDQESFSDGGRFYYLTHGHGSVNVTLECVPVV
jgi:hypothetical protein